MSPNETASALALAACREIGAGLAAISPCAGGDINLAWRLDLDDGRSAFVKGRRGADASEFRDEAAGLTWLSIPGPLGVPKVMAVVAAGGGAGLVLEWLEPGASLSAGGEEQFGRGLAGIHLAGAPAHGSRPPGAAGPVRFGEAQLPPTSASSPNRTFGEVYSERIESLMSQALRNGSIDIAGARTLSELADGMERFCGPDGPPARLHGDLWAGNVMADRDGNPWLIDPAPYGGNPEVDLAMLALFGSLSPRFSAAYDEICPPVEGRAERVLLWQVQPLLVHAVLFGGNYGRSAVRAASHYVGRA